MSRLSQSSINRQQHIPQHIQQAMDQHMQSTMPAHLQHQMGDGAYMSSQSQKAISDHMQKTMPAHLKQYAGAYMEQQVLNPRAAGTVTPTTVQPHAPIPERRRLDHSNVSAAQYDAQFHTNLFAPDSPQPRPEASPEVQPAPPTPPPAEIPPTGPNSPDYGFIMQPPKPPRRRLGLSSLSGSGSPIMRIGLVLGGLLVLLVIFVVIRSLLSGGSNVEALTAITQDQQEMIHIVSGTTGTNSQQQAPLSEANQNFAITAQLTLTSAQTQLVTYMQNNGKKVNTKDLAALTYPAIDQQLTSAASNSTYDATFKQLMQTQLTNYEKALRTAYKQTPGPKGQKLLSDQYNGAQLLLTQLNTPAN